MATTRPATFSGQFYPADDTTCNHMLDEFFGVAAPAAAPGGIVPHAGWVYSGATAALTIAAVAAYEPETVVVFGAAHGPDRNLASLAPFGAWNTPLGPIETDKELAGLLLRCKGIESSETAHTHEHSIEVQLPMLKRALPDAKIVAINVRPSGSADDIGRECAEVVRRSTKKVAFLGSTDLTHYGMAFGFEPQGRGAAGIRWAKEVNDRRFIELIQAMRSDAVVAEATVHRNACGSGAVAATIGAMNVLGSPGYDELAHTCSAEVTAIEGRSPMNSVGYEAGAFRMPH